MYNTWTNIDGLKADTTIILSKTFIKILNSFMITLFLLQSTSFCDFNDILLM